ncbi:hypothetical protein [Salinisphaera sp. LB1]|uniref:hypothetical protein n=1 Tax=Salinisphaera sp. LB1 TaxID=2183911 RepID=UPI0011AB5AE9|nr:hypothetical protein [Salinisphaera sp. LB1]
MRTLDTGRAEQWALIARTSDRSDIGLQGRFEHAQHNACPWLWRNASNKDLNRLRYRAVGCLRWKKYHTAQDTAPNNLA